MKQKEFFRKGLHEALSLFFPSLCFSCNKRTKKLRSPLCPECFKDLSLIEKEGRCIYCFFPLEEEKGVCLECRKSPIVYKRMAAACPYIGGARALLDAFKKSGDPYLAKNIASFMLMQLVELAFPIPDLIIPFPQLWIETVFRGFHPSLMLAKQMGKMLQRPVKILLKRSMGSQPQEAFPYEKRKTLSSEGFQWKKRVDLQGQTILVVDDLMSCPFTLKKFAYRLKESFFHEIYSITFCSADSS